MGDSTLAARIKAYRVEKNLTAKALSKALRLEGSTIGQIERGVRACSAEITAKIENFMTHATEEQLVRFRIDRRGKRRYSKNTLWDVPTIEEIDEELSR